MRIQHNIMAMNAYRNYNTNTSALSRNLEKLSSGYKINRAGDDAAGLAISEKMRAQISGLNTAQKNVKDGISLVKTAEGAMQEVQDMLNRMVELATQSANGTYQDEVDRENLQAEIDQLNAEIDRIADSANFNGIKLLDGSLSKTGGKSYSSHFTLPGEGETLGVDTVLYKSGDVSRNGTSFSVDLHNRVIHSGSKAVFTIDTGDIKLELTGIATGTNAAKVTASGIVDLFMKGSAGALASAGFDLKVYVGGATAAATTGKVVWTGSGVTIKGVKTADGVEVGDVLISKKSARDTRLTFTQVNVPTKAEQVWKPASRVSIKFDATNVEADNIPSNDTQTQSLNNDTLISSQIDDYNIIGFASGSGPKVTAVGTSVILVAAGSAIVTGSIAVVGSLATHVSASLALVSDKLKAAGASGTLAIKFTATKAVLMIGSEELKTVTVEAFASAGTKALDFGSFGKVTLKATAAVTASAIGSMGTVSLKAQFAPGTPAQTAKLTMDTQGASLEEYLKANNSVLGDITLSYASGSDKWSLKVDPGSGASKTFVVTASYASVGGTTTITFKSSTGTSLFAISNTGTKATVTAAVKTAGKTGNGIAIGSYRGTTPTPTPGTKVPTITDFGSTGAAAVATIANALKINVSSSGVYSPASDSDFVVSAQPTTVTVASTAIGGSFATVMNGVSSLGSTIGTIAPFTITIGSVSVSIGTLGSGGTTTASAAMKAVVDALEAWAVQKASADYNALNGSATSITLYFNFRFENAAGSVVGQSIGDEYKLKYDTMTLSLDEEPDPGPANGGGAEYANYDHNVSTTDISRVGLDGKERLASTRFTVEKDKVRDGAKITIGTTAYTFTTDDKYKGSNNGLDGNVYIGDLVDKSGKLLGGDAMTQAMERLTNAAKDNRTYSVGHDGEEITVTQHVDWDNDANKNKFDLSTMEGVAKSLSFTTAGVAGKGGLVLQIGDTADSYNQLAVEIGDLHASALGVGNIDISNQEGAQDAIQNIKNAINTVSSIRGRLGATQNRLEHTQNNLSVMAENVQDAESSIRDTDVAEEMMEYTKNNILVQAAQAMLAQANQVPQGVLQLLG